MDKLFLPWLNNLPVELRRKQRPGLAADIIPYHHYVNKVTNLGQENTVVIHPESKRLIQKSLAEGRILNHIHKPSLQTPHIPAYLVHDSADTGRYRIRCFSAQLACLFADTCKTCRIIAFWERIILYVLNCCLRQRMV